MVTRLKRFVKRAARVLGRTGKTSGKVKADFGLLRDRARQRPTLVRRRCAGKDSYAAPAAFDIARRGESLEDNAVEFGLLRGQALHVL